MVEITKSNGGVTEMFTYSIVDIVNSFELACPLVHPGGREQPKLRIVQLLEFVLDWNSYKQNFNKNKGDIRRTKSIS